MTSQYEYMDATDDVTLTIRELQTDELHMTLALLSTFYPALDRETLLRRLEAIAVLNWRCVGAFEGADLVGLSGCWLNTRLYCGKYLYIDHFIVEGGRRCKGVGAQLLGYLKSLACDQGCEQVCLDTFVTNSLAQSFWSRHGFEIVGFHYAAK